MCQLSNEKRERIRKHLKRLFETNTVDAKNAKVEIKPDGIVRKMTTKDLQDFNFEELAFIADELDMSDLYLRNE